MNWNLVWDVHWLFGLITSVYLSQVRICFWHFQVNPALWKKKSEFFNFYKSVGTQSISTMHDLCSKSLGRMRVSQNGSHYQKSHKNDLLQKLKTTTFRSIFNSNMLLVMLLDGSRNQKSDKLLPLYLYQI